MESVNCRACEFVDFIFMNRNPMLFSLLNTLVFQKQLLKWQCGQFLTDFNSMDLETYGSGL